MPRVYQRKPRSVLRGLRILNAHFTGIYILQRGCFSVCLFAWAVEGLIVKQADESTRIFIYSKPKVNSVRFGAYGLVLSKKQ